MIPPAHFWRRDSCHAGPSPPSCASGIEVRQAVNVGLIKFMCRLAGECREVGVPWAIIAPATSTLLQGGRAHRLVEIWGTRYIATGACRWARRQWATLRWGIEDEPLSRSPCLGSKLWHDASECHRGENVRCPPRDFLRAPAGSFSSSVLEARTRRFGLYLNPWARNDS